LWEDFHTSIGPSAWPMQRCTFFHRNILISCRFPGSATISGSRVKLLYHCAPRHQFTHPSRFQHMFSLFCLESFDLSLWVLASQLTYIGRHRIPFLSPILELPQPLTSVGISMLKVTSCIIPPYVLPHSQKTRARSWDGTTR